MAPRPIIVHPWTWSDTYRSFYCAYTFDDGKTEVHWAEQGRLTPPTALPPPNAPLTVSKEPALPALPASSEQPTASNPGQLVPYTAPQEPQKPLVPQTEPNKPKALGPPSPSSIDRPSSEEPGDSGGWRCKGRHCPGGCSEGKNCYGRRCEGIRCDGGCRKGRSCDGRRRRWL